MIPATWNAPDMDDDDPSAPGRPLPTSVSLHFLRSALRRRWVVCVLSAVLGLLAAAAFLVAFPTPHNAKAMLVLAHDPQADPSRAMSTDVSLLTSRTVAADTIDALGLTMTPDGFLKTLRTEPISSDLVSLTISAPSDAEAVRRLEMLTSTYLAFRTEQISLQSAALVDGMEQRIDELQGQVSDLSDRIVELAGTSGSAAANELSEALSQRAQVNGQIATLQESVQDATLRNSSAVHASRVVDAAAAETGGVRRRVALTLASGLIGGAALGCGIVLFLAITSDRLRRRFDVASALQVPVPVSVDRIAPLRRRWLWLPKLRDLDARRADERKRLAHAIEEELPLPGRWGRLVVACVDNADEVRFALATAAADLTARDRSVLLIDLTEHGGLDAALIDVMGDENVDRPTVLRPQGVPALAGDTADLHPVGHEDEDWEPPSAGSTDVRLVLADLEPAVGADHLRSWTERVVIVVTSGQSSTERVRTAADLVRAAGLDLRFAAMLRADVTDESSGMAGLTRPGPIHLRQDDGSAHEATRKPESR
jgi:capsular polysaccharide biosynthesis protein